MREFHVSYRYQSWASGATMNKSTVITAKTRREALEEFHRRFGPGPEVTRID